MTILPELGSPGPRRGAFGPVPGRRQARARRGVASTGMGSSPVGMGSSPAAMRPSPVDELWVCSLGTLEYREALALQERVRAARQAGAVPDVMLLLEHWPVYTRGRRSAPGEFPMGEDWYRMQGIDIVETDRGAKVTYNGLSRGR